MEIDPESTDIPKLQLQVTFLLHKLKIRQQIISTLQNKTHNPQGLQIQDIISQLEDLTYQYDMLHQNYLKLQFQDDSKIISPNASSIQDLQDTILELNDELNSIIQTVNTKDQEIEALKKKLQVYEKNAEKIDVDNLKSQRNTTVWEEDSKMWKKRYFKEAQTSLQLQQSMNALAEENSCHVECIVLLEKRISNLEDQIFDLNNQQHKQIHEQRLANAKLALSQAKRNPALKDKFDLQVLKTELDCERAVSKDLREQLLACVDSKDQLQQSLSISRHHLLQATMRYEDAVDRVKVLEDMRLSDIQYINRLENGS